MPSPDENQVLKIVCEQGGETCLSEIAAKMGLTTEWTKTIVNSLRGRDLIDVLANGKIKLVEKGWNTLGERPQYDYRVFTNKLEENKGR